MLSYMGRMYELQASSDQQAVQIVRYKLMLTPIIMTWPTFIWFGVSARTEAEKTNNFSIVTWILDTKKYNPTNTTKVSLILVEIPWEN